MTLPAKRPDRSHEMDQFLATIGWGEATRKMLAGDASFRRYERVTWGNRVAVLMDAPPPWEDVRPFVQVTKLLAGCNASVPNIIAADEAQGFLLLEDLGDASFTRLLKAEPVREQELYLAATDALVEIVKASSGNQAALAAAIPPYDMAVYLREAALLAEWLLPQIHGRERALALRAEYLAIWKGILEAAPLQQSVLVHRDYHADNLLWLADRNKHHAVGMIDYQDALLGDPAYDMASLMEDARRDVSPQTVAACLHRFIEASGENEEQFRLRYALLAAQRNAKIIGIFTRLTVRDGKAHYMEYQPRVWAHFLKDISHRALAPVRAFVEEYVPEAYCGSFAVDVSIGGIVV